MRQYVNLKNSELTDSPWGEGEYQADVIHYINGPNEDDRWCLLPDARDIWRRLLDKVTETWDSGPQRYAVLESTPEPGATWYITIEDGSFALTWAENAQRWATAREVDVDWNDESWLKGEADYLQTRAASTEDL